MTEEKTIIRVFETDNKNIGIHTTGTSDQVLRAIGTIVANARDMMK